MDRGVKTPDRSWKIPDGRKIVSDIAVQIWTGRMTSLFRSRTALDGCESFGQYTEQTWTVHRTDMDRTQNRHGQDTEHLRILTVRTFITGQPGGVEDGLS